MMNKHEGNDPPGESAKVRSGSSNGFDWGVVSIMVMAFITSANAYLGLEDVFAGEAGSTTALSFSLALWTLLVTLDAIYKRHS